MGDAVADVFISYSKKDVEQVRLLEAMLEAEGYSVWWDRDLKAGEDFSDTIAKQLELARAVIVLWTESSIKSTFVYAEAANAQFHEKLVPVRAGTIGYEQIRPPFNAIHTEDVANSAEIIRAVQERITEPKSQKYLRHQFRYRLLLIWGVVGSALTIFMAAGAFIELANWAKAIVHYWQEWLQAFWVYIFALVDLEFPPELAGLASAIVFVASTMIAARMMARRPAFAMTTLASYLVGFVKAIIGALVLFGGFLGGLLFVGEASLPKGIEMTALYGGMVGLSSIVFNFRFREMGTLMLNCLANALILGSILALLTTQSIFNELSAVRPDNDLALKLFLGLWFLIFVCTMFAPARAIRQRLVYIVIILAALLGMNALADLGIDISAPKVPS